MSTFAVIPASGSGRRMGQDRPKQYLELAGVPILIHTLRGVAASKAIDSMIVVVPADHLAASRELIARFQVAKVAAVVAGGKLRQDSVAAGLAALPDQCDLVAVHDGARPLVAPELIDACVAAAKDHGAAMAALPVSDTLKEVGGGGRIKGTVDRSHLYQAQTPQVVAPALLRRAMEQAAERGFVGTDEASLLEPLGVEMVVVEGAATNIKVTRPGDLGLATALLPGRGEDMAITGEVRVGHGYDAHRLVADRPLVLGGVTIPHDKGLLGHSDADVLCHALSDAILGALALGDIGRHFPDSDPAYKGISSLLLLEQVVALAAEHGYRLANADVTVVAQAPKLAPFWPEMVANLAKVCGVATSQINLKGTTTEGLGFAGRGEGMAAHGVVTLSRPDQTRR
ncbi:MAG: 2-C-methyl-D-erythritol 4-phosphate cytidylyltransferase [Thermodesulfobacteriota bacterium]